VEVDVNDDEENNDGIDEIHQNINKLKEKKKEKKASKNSEKPKEKKNTLLSFDEELEEEDVTEFKVKKSKESRRLIKLRDKEKKEGDNKNGKSNEEDVKIVGSKNGNDKNVQIIDDDIGIVYKDNVEKKPDTWVVSGKEAESLHMEEEDFSEEERESEDDEDPLKKIIQSGGIPDAAVIHAARKKREAARAAGGGTESRDYIPVRKHKESKAKRGPRLVREEDEEEGEEDRVSFTVQQENKENEYHRKAARSDSDSEPETWEKMQISKAINNQQLMSVDSSLPLAPQPPAISGDRRMGPSLVKPGKYDLPGIRDRMKSRLGDMKEVHRRHEMDADRAVDDIVDSQTKIDQMSHNIPALSRKYKFYQELRGYMTDLTDCYDEKMITIEYLESRVDRVYSEQRGKIRERRRQDTRDQSEVLGAMTASNMAAMVDPVQDAIRDFRVAEREGRRMRRRQYRENKGISGHNDGMSSDDELPTKDATDLKRLKEDVQNQAGIAMEDVVEEFSVIGQVMDRLQSWRHDDDESYKSAYVSLCLPKIFSPLIRLEMLFWSPLEDSSPVSNCEWFSTLATYAVLEGDKFNMWQSDPDRNLVSSCSEKVILPRLLTIVKSSYDPMSTTHTNNLVTFLTKLVSDCPTISMRSKQLRELLSGVVNSIKDSIDNDVYIPMYTKHQMEYPGHQHAHFFNRQFWSVFKLYKNVLSWAGILADNILSELVLDKLLNRYLLMSLRANLDNNDSVIKSKLIVDLLPKAWLVPGSPEMTKMTMLTRYMSGLGCCQGVTRDSIIEVAKIVRILGDFETGEKLRELLY